MVIEEFKLYLEKSTNCLTLAGTLFLNTKIGNPTSWTSKILAQYVKWMIRKMKRRGEKTKFGPNNHPCECSLVLVANLHSLFIIFHHKYYIWSGSWEQMISKSKCYIIYINIILFYFFLSFSTEHFTKHATHKYTTRTVFKYTSKSIWIWTGTQRGTASHTREVLSPTSRFKKKVNCILLFFFNDLFVSFRFL